MESDPIQKEFGEVQWIRNHLIVKKLGTDRQIGQITLMEKNEPTRHYLAAWLWVSKNERRKGFASQLIGEVEQKSRETGIPILLHDDVDAQRNPHAVGMYAHRPGWIEIHSRLARTGRAYVYGADEAALEALAKRGSRH